MQPPTSAPVESSPPRIAAGKARSATAEPPGVTPGVGEAGEEEGGDRGEPARDDPGQRRDPAQPDPHERRRLAVLGRGAHRDAPVEYLKASEEQRDQDAGDDGRDQAVLADADVADPERRRRPTGRGTLRMSEPIRRISSVSRMMSTPMVTIASLMPGAAAQPVDDQPLDDQRRERRDAMPTRTAGRSRAVGQPGDRVGAQQQQRAVGEVDHLAGLEDDHEADGDERVDAPERDAVEQSDRNWVTSVPGVSEGWSAASAGSSRRRSRGRPG